MRKYILWIQQQFCAYCLAHELYAIHSECYIGLPSKPEQTKIATLLRLIDERVATQNKIIEKYESLIQFAGDILYIPYT